MPSATVDPVRSIRVAQALNDRFRAVIETPQEVNGVAEVELAIGEAQQIYPEIWRHLDEARAALAEMGTRVPEYDAIRATERPGQQAVSDIDSTALINPLALAMGDGIEVARLKVVTFHREGHDKARAACQALMRAMPRVNWAALDRQDQQQIEAAGSLSAPR